MSTVYYQVLVPGLTYRGIVLKPVGQIYAADSVLNADIATFTSETDSGNTFLETTETTTGAITLPSGAPEVNDFSQGPTGAVQISANSGGLGGDTNFQYNQVASAVNGIEVSSAVTTGVPSIVATGTDTNVDIAVKGQGTGTLWLNSAQNAGAGISPTGVLTGSTVSGFKRKRTATAANYTVVATDSIVGVTSTVAARTITLPSPSTVGAGWSVTITDESDAAGTNHITVAPHVAETITPTANITTNGGHSTVYTDGTNWFSI